jgi:hypothetical protein
MRIHPTLCKVSDIAKIDHHAQRIECGRVHLNFELTVVAM